MSSLHIDDPREKKSGIAGAEISICSAFDEYLSEGMKMRRGTWRIWLASCPCLDGRVHKLTVRSFPIHWSFQSRQRLRFTSLGLYRTVVQRDYKLVLDSTS